METPSGKKSCELVHSLGAFPHTETLPRPNHGGPANKRRTLEVKEQENAAKEAFNATAFAQFLACLQVGGKQERFALRAWDSRE